MEEKSNRKTLTLLIGGSIGLLTGLAAAVLVLRKQEQTGKTVKFSTSDGAKIGMGVVSLLRMISDTVKKLP